MRKVLRQAWELSDAAKAEKLLRNLARRLDHGAPGVSGSILEGLDEILTVSRLGLPAELRRSLACTNIIENMNGTHPPRLPQRQTLERCLHGAALDRGCHDGGGKRLPPAAESLQASASPAGRPHRSSAQANERSVFEEGAGIGQERPLIP